MSAAAPTVDPQVHQDVRGISASDYRATAEAEIAKAIVGHEEIIDGVLTCLFVGGHALLEGVPGLGKTALIRALAASAEPEVQPNPVHARSDARRRDRHQRHHGKRARPARLHLHGRPDLRPDCARRRNQPRHAQNAVGHARSHAGKAGDGRRSKSARSSSRSSSWPRRIPLEQEGTYPLPEAQLDRFFFKLIVNTAAATSLKQILDRTTTGYKSDDQARPRRRTKSSPTSNWSSAS